MLMTDALWDLRFDWT